MRDIRIKKISHHPHQLGTNKDKQGIKNRDHDHGTDTEAQRHTDLSFNQYTQVVLSFDDIHSLYQWHAVFHLSPRGIRRDTRNLHEVMRWTRKG